MVRDALFLTALFAGTALAALWYYRSTPTVEYLRQRLPNRVSFAGLLLTALIGVWVWWIWQTAEGFSRVRVIIGVLFNLLIFETVFILLMRRIRSNVAVVILASAVVAGFVWLQRSVGGIIVYNLTFMFATLGATTLLVRMQYLRTWFLFVVSGLWMVFDILSVAFIYPQIYKVSDRPHTSFIFPAVAAGQVTLGSGDFMFLVLMSLVLFRDFGRRAAVVHIGLQSLALVTTILIKSRETLFPYLTVMVPIFLLTWLGFHLITRKRVASKTRA